MAFMLHKDTVAWAKEEILAAIDAMVAEKKASHSDDEIDRDEELELEKQRDRVAKFLGLPEKRKRPSDTALCRERVQDGGQNICTRLHGHGVEGGEDVGGHRCKAADVDSRIGDDK